MTRVVAPFVSEIVWAESRQKQEKHKTTKFETNEIIF